MVKCPVFKALEPHAPKQQTNNAAITGTATHFIGECAIRHGYATQLDYRLCGACVWFNKDGDAVRVVCGPGCEKAGPYSFVEWVDKPHKISPEYPTIVIVDENMVDSVKVYTKLVAALLEKYPGATLRIEERIELAPDTGGYADCTIITEDKIINIDYKNGRNYVDVNANPQLAMYAVGALNKFGGPHTKEIVMCIVQPNSNGDPIRTWKQTTSQVAIWADVFSLMREKNIEVEALYQRGQDISEYAKEGPHCKWCPSMSLCPAMQAKTKALVKELPALESQSKLPAPGTLNDEKLIWLANNGDMIIEYINQCKAYMTTQALEGKKWPGYKLVERQTRRKLINQDELAKHFKDNDMMDAFDVKLKTLTQLEKLYGKDEIADYVEKPQGALELVPSSDRRKETNQSILAQLPKL